jgi:hypothetical protein
MQKATKAAGGNTLIVLGYGGLDLVDLRSGQVVSSTEVMRGRGVALKAK